MVSLGSYNRQAEKLPSDHLSSKGVKLGPAKKKKNLLMCMKSAMQIVEHKLWFCLFCSNVKIANSSARSEEGQGRRQINNSFSRRDLLFLFPDDLRPMAICLAVGF